MFSYISLKNFKSLVDFSANFMGKKNKPKNLILIYGENGIGKSNLAYAFYALAEFLKTRSYKVYLDNLIERYSDKEPKYSALTEEIFRDTFKSTESIIKQCKTIDSKENMVLEFGFIIKSKKGKYYIETNDEMIVSEKLEYVISKNQIVLFDLKAGEIKLHNNLFIDEEYKQEISEQIDRYWGKHSLLSILVHEFEDKNIDFVKLNFSEPLLTVINSFLRISTKVRKNNKQINGSLGIDKEILFRLSSGEIPLTDSNDLKKAEEFINEFFTRLYTDVKQAYYLKEEKNKRIKYELYFKKLIFGKIIDVNFKEESSGTQNLLDMLPYFLHAVRGESVILDEIDTGIHDILVSSLLDDLSQNISGQIIMTTHNTVLLESLIDKEAIYVFDVDQDARKRLVPISEYEKRLHPNLNIRKRYLQGLYRGIPTPMSIDFEELVDIME